jgi:uncharacterized protein (DUF433 family)
MPKKIRDANEILDRITGDDPELREMIAEEVALLEAASSGRIRWQDHVVPAEDLHHGSPCIKGTRIPVKILIGSLADGMMPVEILEACPQLSENDLLAALGYAAEVLAIKNMSIEEASDLWDTHSIADVPTRAVDIEYAPGGHTTLVAIEDHLLDRLTQNARERGVSVETLINLWLQEKLRA